MPFAMAGYAFRAAEVSRLRPIGKRRKLLNNKVFVSLETAYEPGGREFAERA
jgi:hypothetical protein